MLASLLALSDVFATGLHAVVKAGVRERTTVTVIGDGAVGLSAVLAARRLGAERILLMGRHTARTDLGREFGATDVVADRGDEGIAKVGGLSSGEGAHAVLECVGTKPGFDMGAGVVRAGGAISRVGAPQYEEGPIGRYVFLNNITVTGGIASARHDNPELLPDVLEGKVQPGRVFDQTLPLDVVPAGYQAMAGRRLRCSSSRKRITVGWSSRL
jgi:threonine dehydrogenase-like Zn-dependent dehydrogenase